jgi:phosphoenolpyruvate-protein kinase (PTS system EI component)
VIASGGTIHGAVTLANVLRKDVLAWRRDLPHFAAALQQAFADRDLMLRERAMTLADLAYQTLGDILRDDKASPSVQFKAARFIIEQATAPTPSEVAKRRASRTAPKCTKMHKPGDSQNKPLPTAA